MAGSGLREWGQAREILANRLLPASTSSLNCLPSMKGHDSSVLRTPSLHCAGTHKLRIRGLTFAQRRWLVVTDEAMRIRSKGNPRFLEGQNMTGMVKLGSDHDPGRKW